MGEFDDLLKTGDKILNQVNKAVSTGDYSQLGNNIRNQVQEAVNKAYTSPSQNFQGRAAAGRTVNYASMRYRSPFFLKKISSTKGIFKIIFGGLGIAYNAFFGLTLLIASISEIYTIIPAVIFVLIAAAFGLLLKSGIDDRKLMKFYEKYGRILGRAEYFSIDDLALAAAEKPDQVRKNIKMMIKKDFLPTAKMDLAETTVMLSQRAYDQYIQAEMSRKEREKFDRNAALSKANEQPVKAQNTEDNRVSGIVREGNDYIANIRRINDAIPGDEMSEKLYKLENIMKRIFVQVEKQPECADDLRKFMNYYLPTTSKLLNAYVDLDRQPEVGNNITQTKKQIEDAIDVINDAFENLLDSLFQDMAWDISSDISVMKTMMAQDGLTESGLYGAGQGSQSSQGQNMASTAQQGQTMTSGGAMAQAAPQTQTELKF